MSFSQYLAVYAGVFISLAVLDMLYIKLGGLKRYEKHLGSLLRVPMSYAAAVPLYLISVAGYVYLAIRPAVIENNLSLAVVNSMFLGLLLFSFYELTNLATIKKWPLGFAIGEIIWGIFASAIMGMVGFKASTLV